MSCKIVMFLWLVLVIVGAISASPPPFEHLPRRPRKQANTIVSLDLHPTLYQHHDNNNITTASAVYPPHTHRRLKEFHERRHLSRYEQILLSSSDHNEDDLHTMFTWNGEYDDAFFHAISANNDTTTTAHRQRSLAGGQLSQYQAVPLSQGYGTHFASLWVGSPTPQRKTVIVDTGSHYTAFPCTGCRNCGGNHHTDPYFDPNQSDSFHQLLCEECQDGVGCTQGACSFRQAYTEGSSWEAVQVRDTVYCGGQDVLQSADPQYQKYAIEFMFGCQRNMAGLFITQLADGIMGMSAHPATLPKKLFDAKKIERNQFAMCFRRELGTSKRGVTAGSMTLGGYKTSLDTSKMVFAKNIVNIGWFTVYVKNIYVRPNGGLTAKSIDPRHATIRVRADLKALNSGKGVIVDSGTTDTYLNKGAAKEFIRAWRKATGQKYSHSPMTLTPEQLRALPTILIQCQAYSGDEYVARYEDNTGYTGSLDRTSPGDLLIAIPATSYMDYNPVSKRYVSRLYFTETAGGVLGSNTMQGHNVLFDWQNGRVGFAESSCAYDKEDVPEIAEDRSFSSDCQVSDPILTKPCIDSVDRRICQQNSANVALLGTETWTAIVESPGTESGVLCTEASKRESTRPLSPFDMEPEISCDSHGTCKEVRSCALTCAQLQVALEVKPLHHDKENKCGDSEWSACDYGCHQTRIQTQLFSDGNCYELSRETRPCHTGACAYADLCKVPYIVHAILLFGGGSLDHWSLHSEEVLALALVRASRASAKQSLFEAGDINVMMALPWYLDQDELDANAGIKTPPIFDYTEDANSEKLGTRVIVEISVVNPAVNTSRVISTAEPNSLNDILRNITNNISGITQQQQCDKEHMYELAKTALDIKNILLEPSFMHMIQTELNSSGAEDLLEFRGTSLKPAQTSRILSAWTIQRSIGETINYNGPRRPIWSQLLLFVENVIILTLASILILMVWNWGNMAFEQVSHYYFIHHQQRQPASSRESMSDDEIETSILMGTDERGSHQLLHNHAHHKLTSPKKRPRRQRQ